MSELTTYKTQELEKSYSTLKDVPTIFSRIENFIKQPLKVIDDEKLALINERIVEINDKMYNFMKQDSQTTRKMMTLQMLDTADNTYRVLQQILANIEKRQSAITDNFLKMKENYLKMKEIEEQLSNETDEVEKTKLTFELQKFQIGTANGFGYLEAAMKEVGALQDAYEQILKNKNIPKDWDELDFELAEVQGHIRNAFRLGVRDILMTGNLNVATCEYFEQYGISPFEALFHIRTYITYCNEKMNEANQTGNLNVIPDYDNFLDFLNQMSEIFKDHYKKALRRIGLDDIISPKFLLLSDRNKEEIKKLSDK